MVDVGVVALEWVDPCGAPILLRHEEGLLLLPLKKKKATLEIVLLTHADVVHGIVVADVDPGIQGTFFGPVCCWWVDGA